ncbi:MAG: hydantoinase/oxoprolinase family protein [Deltaproteobacteria bacterium]|nr:hydantoinase/oxoprolinase family protein [Deltaproteobacteria bacterium]
MILGIDVGGTHTDAVLIDRFRVVKKVKVPTEGENLRASLQEATRSLLDRLSGDAVQRVVMSTTLSTNAIVQNKIDRVGMALLSGPGLAPALMELPENTCLLKGYVNHRGIEISPGDPGEALRIAEVFQAQGITHAGVVGKFSARNPGQEIAVAKALETRELHVSLGHRMSGHLNFPRRIETTYLNEAIGDLYRRFATDVLRFVREQRMTAPIYILKADGGTFDIERSLEFPVQTILSGPAASVMGIMTMTGACEDAIALDIGGTTTDIALFADGVPLFEPFGLTIEGRKTLIRGMRTRSIGIGGDSAVRLQGKTLSIGPDRVGPAAAFGGPLPTPTDAMVVLGLTAIGDGDRAAASLRPLACARRESLAETAAQIFGDTCASIALQVRAFIDEINNQPVYTIHELLEGKQLRPRLLYVVGGPAQPMAAELGRLLECEPRIPAHAEVANAIGAALARTTAELTLLADTERRMLSIAEEGIQLPIPHGFTSSDAIRLGKEKLRAKVLQMGGGEEALAIEVVEVQEFNMVRECSTAGKNIRVKVQIKPGAIAGLMQEAR